MAYTLIAPQGSATFTLAAAQKIAVKSLGEAQVFSVVGFPNYPTQNSVLASINNATFTSSAFASGGTVLVQAGPYEALVSLGTDPVISDSGIWQPQGAPVNITDGGSMIATPAALLSGIVTATPTAGRNVQLPSVADLNAATSLAVGESFDWSLITLAAFALTITLNGSHTIVGAAATGATSGSAARFRTRKDSASSFITYRLA